MAIRSTTPRPRSNPLPLQFTPFRKEQFQSDEGIAFFNQTMAQVFNAINRGTGQAGPVVIPSGLDVAGGTVTGLGSPSSPSDAVSLAHSNANYGAENSSKQLDIGGTNTLKGLAYCYQQVQANTPAIAAIQAVLKPGATISGTVVLAKITGGGSNGSLTFIDGVISAFTPPS